MDGHPAVRRLVRPRLPFHGRRRLALVIAVHQAPRSAAELSSCASFADAIREVLPEYVAQPPLSEPPGLDDPGRTCAWRGPGKPVLTSLYLDTELRTRGYTMTTQDYCAGTIDVTETPGPAYPLGDASARRHSKGLDVADAGYCIRLGMAPPDYAVLERIARRAAPPA